MNTILIMKKILMVLMGFVGLIGFVGCDKIEEGEYTIYDGAAVTWMSGSFSEEPVQRVYVEKYTGPKCSNCPLADSTLGSIHNERVVMVSINHPTGQGVPFPNEPDLRTEGGSTWAKYYGINAIPSSFINRDKSKQYQGRMSEIVGAINEALSVSPTVGMEMFASQVEGEVYVYVQLKFVKSHTDPVTLTVALVEDSLSYKQLLPNGDIDEEYVHNHMLRKVVTGYWGTPVKCTGVVGEALDGSLNFSVDEGVNLANSHIVAFISDKETRKVLNCASCKISIDKEDE